MMEGNRIVVEVLAIVDKGSLEDPDQNARAQVVPLRDIPMLRRTGVYLTIAYARVIRPILVFHARVFEAFEQTYLVGATDVFATFDGREVFAHLLSAVGLSIRDLLLPQRLEYETYRFRVRFNEEFQKALKEAGRKRSMTVKLVASAACVDEFLRLHSADTGHGSPAVENLRSASVMGLAHQTQNDGLVLRNFPTLTTLMWDVPIVQSLCFFFGNSYYYHPVAQRLTLEVGG
jgi:hypothetical protein